MPGVTHWQSPHMHAYFPALNSPASLLADMLADAINCLGFTWVRTIIYQRHARVKGNELARSASSCVNLYLYLEFIFLLLRGSRRSLN